MQGAMSAHQLFCFRPVAGWADHRTPIRGLYLANTTQIYPEDRGMNYSIRLGQTAAKTVAEDR